MTIRALALAAALVASIVPNPSLALASGQHDFDFDFGTWTTHIKRLPHPFSDSSAWATYTGTVTVRKVWGGNANVEEIEADGPSHLELMNVRMYNVQSHQWSLNGADGSDNTIGPPMYGEFHDGRGVFYDQETYDGKAVLVRQTFSGITAHSYDFEQALSEDGGAHWKPNFVAHLTRDAASAPSEGSQSVADTNHDFDFNYATWHTSIRSLNVAANGTTSWDALEGTVALRKIWNGRAFLEEIKAGNAHGGFQGLTLYLYSPQTHQWSQTYAGEDTAAFEPSMIGSFHDGRGELISGGTFQGRNVFTRDTWSDIRATTHHFEIDYSADGGATWKPEFVANLHRIGPGR